MRSRRHARSHRNARRATAIRAAAWSRAPTTWATPGSPTRSRDSICSSRRSSRRTDHRAQRSSRLLLAAAPHGRDRWDHWPNAFEIGMDVSTERIICRRNDRTRKTWVGPRNRWMNRPDRSNSVRVEPPSPNVDRTRWEKTRSLRAAATSRAEKMPPCERPRRASAGGVRGRAGPFEDCSANFVIGTCDCAPTACAKTSTPSCQ
jgi:hypothetical protein